MIRCDDCGEGMTPHRDHICRAWCRDCGAELLRDTARYAYVHREAGADHAPRPTRRKPEAVA